MSIEVIGVDSFAYNASMVTHTFTVPGGVSASDYAIAVLCAPPDAAMVTPTGWSALHDVDGGGYYGNHTSVCYGTGMTTGDTFDISESGTGSLYAAVIVYLTGVDSLVYGATTTTGGASVQTLSTSLPTLTAPSRWGCTAIGCTGGYAPFTIDSGYTIDEQVASGAFNGSDEIQAAFAHSTVADSTGTPTWTAGGAGGSIWLQSQIEFYVVETASVGSGPVWGLVG